MVSHYVQSLGLTFLKFVITFCIWTLVLSACVASLLVPSDGPIITEDELTSLPLVRVVPDGQYTGPKLNSVVRMMRGLLDQKVPLQEFEVRIHLI